MKRAAFLLAVFCLICVVWLLNCEGRPTTDVPKSTMGRR